MDKKEIRSVSDSKRKRILKRDNNECQICGEKKNLEVHHIRAIVYGGDSSDENLITLCKVCHRYAPESGDKAFKLYKKSPQQSLYDRMMQKSHIRNSLYVATFDFIQEKTNEYVSKGFITESQRQKILLHEAHWMDEQMKIFEQMEGVK